MFQQIVCLDQTKLQSRTLQELQNFSKDEVKVYDSNPKSEEEIIRRIGNADAVLLSWNTPLEKVVLESCPNIKYIGLCCTYYNEEACNVDVAATRKRGIKLTAIKDYADEGVIEFILYYLIDLCKGWNGRHWKAEAVELNGKTLGIIGMGTLGQLLGRAAQALGMNIIYYSRSQKPAAREAGFHYLPQEELLKNSDIVSTHLPRNTRLLGKKEFGLMRKGSILVNTSLGPTFEPGPFMEWLKQEGNYAIIDKDGSTGYSYLFAPFPNIIGMEHAAGWSAEARKRLSEKVLDNLKEHLQEHPK